MKSIRIVYGFNPFLPPRTPHAFLTVVDSYVYLIGVNGEKKLLSKHDDTDLENRSTTWKNSCLTIARKHAEKLYKFYGVRPERMENNKTVKRSFNYSILIKEIFGEIK